MKESNLRMLCCPACRENYHARVIATQGDQIETAFLTCPRCWVVIPVLHGFPIFQEQHLNDGQNPDELSERLFGKTPDYETFLNLKREKPVYDLYAAFQPFNESTQSIFPLIPILREAAKPGDLILDLWCRTGWSGELLASLFPQQQILSLWESSSGLLGLKGFHYWLGTGKRCKNLDIIFHSPNQPLPFKADTFSIVHGLDTLHRYHHVPLISECMRVVRENGIVVFPHNHLTNSEPVPYFDRGEDQLHGKEYQQYFQKLLQGSDRKAFILSEKRLFDSADQYRVMDEPDTDHYNACILIANETLEGRFFQREQKQLDRYSNAHVVVNPLWNVNFMSGVANPAPEAMDRGGETLFFRHPMYLDRLNQFAPLQCEEIDLLILYWALRLRTVAQIATILKVHPEEVFERLKVLELKEVIQIQNISLAMARLQYYYCHQEIIPLPQEATLDRLWLEATSKYSERPLLIWPKDESVFTYSDSDTIVGMAVAFLQNEGVKTGDRIIIAAQTHPEFFFIFWATVLMGAIAVPVNPEIASDAFESILSRVEPGLVFATPEFVRDGRISGRVCVVYGAEEGSPEYEKSFSQRLAEFEPVPSSSTILEEQPAVMLFTSGSTGAPKGVVLSHGALYRTSRIIDRAYHWAETDRFLSGGNFHTMSGLRNPCIAPLHSGASLVIPPREELQNPLNVMGLCLKFNVSILNVTPAFLAYWTRAAGKAKFYASHTMRMVLSTGSNLHPLHRESFESNFHCPVYDYYGLTETTGACILENEELHDAQEKGIGRPWGCLVKVLTQNNSEDRSGELAIYSENLMLAYFRDEALTASRFRDGWLLTGDIACVNSYGCVELFGRKDRMMVDRNGENVYPEEIERHLNRMESVAESYVTLYQDASMTDQIASLVLFREGFDGAETIEKLRAELGKRLPPQHVPTILLPVTEMPKGPGGKVSQKTARMLIDRELKRSTEVQE